MTQPSLFFDRRCTVKKLRKFGAQLRFYETLAPHTGLPKGAYYCS